MAKRKHSLSPSKLRQSNRQSRLRHGGFNFDSPTLVVSGCALVLLSLSFCPVAHMLTTSDHVVPDKTSQVSPSPVKVVESPEFHEALLRQATPFVLEDAVFPDPNNHPRNVSKSQTIHQVQFPIDVSSDLLGNESESLGPLILEHLELLSDDDKLAVSLGSNEWALSLENLNSSMAQQQLGKMVGDRLIQGFQAGLSSGNLTGAGIYMEDAERSEDDDLFLIPKKLLVETFERAEEKWLSTRKLLDERFVLRKGADAKGPIGTAFAFQAPNEESLALSNTSSLLEYASRQFITSLETSDKLERRRRRIRRSPIANSNSAVIFEEDAINLDGDDETDRADFDSLHTRFIRQSLNSMNGPAAQCGLNEERLPCDTNTRFRTYTGFCNNIRHPNWGKSVITFDRMVNSRYDDGISIPRSRSVTGVPLPSPRVISSKVHIDVSHLSNRHTLMLMQYAQFVDHDITFTPVHKGPEGKILNCRDCESALQTHPECWPIRVPGGDSYYPPMNQDSGRAYCIPFTRSLPGQQRLGPREQINQNSAYLDSSQIYGENLCKSLSLRSPGGKLNVTGHPVIGAKPLMPQITFLKECKSPSGFCFYAGDPRASEQPALAAMHTIFLRQHNSWADRLRAINRHWNDERIFEEVRRILSATNQHIIYSEMLPRLLGNSMIQAYGLSLQNDGYYASYDSNCPATIYNEFATAAYRFGHSLVRPNLARMDNRYNGMNPHIALRDGFFNSDMLYHPLMIDELMRGLLGEPMEQLDPFITKEVTNHLFEDKKKQFSGMDLISLNIHRGRDHGLPGYNSYREVCGLKKAVTFQDFSSEIPSDVLGKLKETYANVDDIDLFTGSISERPASGALLGPTMTCIIGTQFKRLRQCDRFWYETNDRQLRFTPQQLAEIRKMTMSKVVCDNLDMPGEIQRSSFDAPHNVLNPRVPCDKLPALNLESWRESPPAQSLVRVNRCNIGGKFVDVGQSALPSPCNSCVCTPEGTRCASLRITSCQRLFTDARREDILKDSVCMSQCGFLMGGSGNRINNNIDGNKLGSGRSNQHPNSIFNFISRIARPLRL